jgi:hypothetical protein
MRYRRRLFVTLLGAASACGGNAFAQDAGLSVSLGARAWYAQWTTFSYFAQNNVNQALTQVSADDKFVLVPTVSLRYGDFIGSLSAMPSTSFNFADGGTGKREELDANLGYSVLPGLVLTLGYKKVSQRDGNVRYEPAGAVAGVSGNAALAGAVSMYGALAFGRLKTPTGGGDEVVKFKADYRLTELGLAYGLNTGGGWPRRWTFTAGYRIQILGSKEAFGTQDGRDTTQGLTLGALATF